MGNAFVTKIICYIEIALLALGGVGALISVCLPTVLIDVILQYETNSFRREEIKSELGVFTALVAAAAAVVILLWLIIVITLYKGSQERGVARLMTWIIVNSITCALIIFALLSVLIKNPQSIMPHIPTSIFLIYRIWSLYVVHSLMNEIRFMPRQPQNRNRESHSRISEAGRKPCPIIAKNSRTNL